MEHLTLFVGMAGFVLGVVLTYLADKDSIKRLDNEINKIKANAAKNLLDADERIRELEEENRKLTIQLINNESRNNS